MIPYQQKDEVKEDLNDEKNCRAACKACNGFGNRTKFEIPEGLSFEKQIAHVFQQKKKVIKERRDEYRKWWEENVKPRLHESVD